MEDSLVVEEGMLAKSPSVPLATCLLHLQLLFQDYFHREKVKQPHCRDTQRPKIMNLWERERVHPCNVCDKAFKSLQMPS